MAGKQVPVDIKELPDTFQKEGYTASHRTELLQRKKYQHTDWMRHLFQMDLLSHG